jgi:hypothetical protein
MERQARDYKSPAAAVWAIRLWGSPARALGAKLGANDGSH